MRVLAIDYGEKRMGIALSDPLGITAQPLPFLLHDHHMWNKLTLLIQEKTVTEIVVGLPITLKGTHSAMTHTVEKFVTELKTKTTALITLQDERLSSKASERLLIEANVSREKRKDLRDSMVASMILQDYLERKSNKAYEEFDDLA